MSWVALEGAEFELMVARLNFPVRPKALRMSVRQAPFYREGVLMKIEDAQCIAHVVAAGTGMVATRELIALNGLSERLHHANRQARIHLPDIDTADAYLRFFCEHLRTAEGLKFAIVDALQPGWEVEGIGPIAVTPLRIGNAGHGGGFTGHAVMEHAGMLFEATFRIQPDGLVEMSDDVPLGPLVRRLAS